MDHPAPGRRRATPPSRKRLPLAAVAGLLAGCGPGGPPPETARPETLRPDATAEPAVPEPEAPQTSTIDPPPPYEPVPWSLIEAYLLTEYPDGLGEEHGLDADLADLDGDGTTEILVQYVSAGTLESYVFRRLEDRIEPLHRGSEFNLVELPVRSGRPGLVDTYRCCGYNSISVWVLDRGEPAMTEVYRLGYGPAEGGGTECGEGDDTVYVEDVVELELSDPQGNRTRQAPGAIRPGLRLEAILVATGCPADRRWTTYRLEELLGDRLADRPTPLP